MSAGAKTWLVVRGHFDASCELAEDDRDAYLAAIERADVRERVRALLRADAAPSELLDGSPLAVASAPLAELEAGSVVGGHRLRERVGEGGTSVVWSAEPVSGDGPPVAVKVLKPGFALSSIPARFERERAALEALVHPGVPRLEGAGETDDGRPFLVTELVEGDPIDAWCDARGADRDERLRLFAELCEIVHHAHRHLIVHRDLKPSNVLVTEEGQVRVLDFGLAKLLDPELEPDWTGVHGPGPRTPGFASPEQIAGRPISTATDVYSLGVVLFWLVVGRSPYDASERTELEREVVEHGARPLRFREPGARARDLFAILDLALRSRPEERYPTAQHLAEDVRRWLAGRAVRAREWRPIEAVVRGVRRRPVASALVVGAAALALGAWLGTLRSLDRVRASESLAWRAHAQAVHSTNLITALVVELGDDPELRPLLAERLRATEATLTELEGAAEAEARVRMALASAFLHLGDRERAREHAQRALELALSTRGLGAADVHRCRELLRESLAE